VLLDETGHELLAFLAGRLMQNSIRVVPGDRVVVEVFEYDSHRGRIVWRHP
jgi:translation initiation factor IF-1